MADARDAARRWAAAWQQGWEAPSVERIVALYAPDATFSTEPFREVYRGREGVRTYVATAFAEEDDARVWTSEPIVDGLRASISCWASLREDGVDTTLAGTSVLLFTDDGLVAQQWDAWNTVPRRHVPPNEATPFTD